MVTIKDSIYIEIVNKIVRWNKLLKPPAPILKYAL